MVGSIALSLISASSSILSVGERQRVEIVRCLLQDPKLLILDEPTSVLTPQAVQKLFDTLRRLVEQPARQRVELSLSVPPGVEVTVSTVSAPILASGLRQGVTANTVSGEVTLSDIEGPTKLNTVSGSAECVGLRGRAKLNTVSGSLTVQASEVQSASLNTVSGEIVLDLSNGRAEISSNSVSGDVTVRAPYTGYAVSATSAAGQVVVDGRLLAKGTRRGPRKLSEGDESLRVRANSVSGSVVVLRTEGPAGSTGPQDAPAETGPTTPASQDAPFGDPGAAWGQPAYPPGPERDPSDQPATEDEARS